MNNFSARLAPLAAFQADWQIGGSPNTQGPTQSDVKMPFKVKLVHLYTWEKYDTQNSEFALGQVGQIEDWEDCVFFGIGKIAVARCQQDSGQGGVVLWDPAR